MQCRGQKSVVKIEFELILKIFFFKRKKIRRDSNPRSLDYWGMTSTWMGNRYVELTIFKLFPLFPLLLLINLIKSRHYETKFFNLTKKFRQINIFTQLVPTF